NVDPDDESHPKVARVLEQARKVAGGPPPQALDALAEICREHAGAEPGLGDTCVHLDGYGTRSAFLLQLPETSDVPHSAGPGAGAARLAYADGPPCRNEFRDFSQLLFASSRMQGDGRENGERTVS
ncbi:MAG: hypothetical protein MJE66_12540, partial [Proteobacteria bacterium]|nr:hypothetical protein [Pseudomonadota bacterium]